MDVFFYLLLGFFDIFTIMIFTFCMFRFPASDYLREFCLIAGVASSASFVNRMVLEMPIIDPGIQFVLITLFMRFMLQFRSYEATLVSAVGYLGYTGGQFLIFPLLYELGVTSLADLTELTGWGISITQVLSDLLVLGVSLLVKRLHLGFSFVPQPPHSFTISQKPNKLEQIMVAGVSFGVISLLSVVYLMAVAQEKTVYLLLVIFVPIMFLLWLLRKREQYA